MKKLFLSLALFIAIVPVLVNAEGTDELWEVQTTMDIGIALPGVAMPANTYTVCLGKGGAYKPEKFLQEQNCEVLDFEVVGNKSSWKVRCTGDNPMEAQGEVIRNANTMSGTVYVSSRGLRTTQVISGTRIGTCQQQ